VTTVREQLNHGLDALRDVTDERGHELLESIQSSVNYILDAVPMLANMETEEGVVRVFACNPDESAGLADVIPIR
jgi:hypothetical protein